MRSTETPGHTAALTGSAVNSYATEIARLNITRPIILFLLYRIPIQCYCYFILEIGPRPSTTRQNHSAAARVSTAKARLSSPWPIENHFLFH